MSARPHPTTCQCHGPVVVDDPVPVGPRRPLPAAAQAWYLSQPRPPVITTPWQRDDLASTLLERP